MPTRVRLRALAIVIAALAAVAMPTAAAFTDTAELHHPLDASPTTPREQIQPAANIVGEIARKGAKRSTGQTLGMLPQPSRGASGNLTVTAH
ncbi:SipW-dependent-type signal peptide-containing protein [Streptomyces luteolus]|uniref:SipW-dependent-type signal peptide-containing protein n=1 Tax=Streptomyces luteolus TaxID=3043615 RepID=A0ABT6T7P3_9ACTN|nr:SipW-dependent-type signal peptide-containing protein [Streptomyces sp. B-S-A12]MDI3423839.1 SipW-dependent-type signal peptide-containing protein [Streptomyces sp. B-S-A12]